MTRHARQSLGLLGCSWDVDCICWLDTGIWRMFVGWGVSTARVKTMVKPTQTRRSSNGLAPTAAAGAQRSGTGVAGAFCFGRMHCCSVFNGTECWSGSKFHHCRFASSVLLLCVYMARVISRTKHHTVQLFRHRAAQSFVSFNRLPLVPLYYTSPISPLPSRSTFF